MSGLSSYKILGLMLGYPATDWLAAHDELIGCLRREALLTKAEITALTEMLNELTAEDLLDAQADYVDTFDRVPSCCLHLFEHVHGDSKDRGQAMVDLAERYAEVGLEMEPGQLPDYLPAFLEYLSVLPAAAALESLREPTHVFQAIAIRVARRNAPQTAVFNVLLRLCGRDAVQRSGTPGEAEPNAVLDRRWAEPAVDFLGAASPSACGTSCSSGGCSSSSTSCGA